MSILRNIRVAAVLVAASAPACLAEADEEAEWTDARAATMADGTPGDADYGAYLVQECTACHAPDGAGGVPPIAGIAPGYFREAMAEYASRARENAVMENVARSLGDEELAALSAYFAAQYSEDD